MCEPGAWGLDCSERRPSADGTFTRISEGPQALAAHTALYDESSDALYVFGGYDLNRARSELWRYAFANSAWQLLSNESSPHALQPAGRYSHAAVLYNNSIYLMGGIVPSLAGDYADRAAVYNGSLNVADADPTLTSNETWRFRLDDQSWDQPDLLFSGGPLPPLSGHSMTLVDSTAVIIGGATGVGLFSTRIFHWDLATHTLIAVNPSGAPAIQVWAGLKIKLSQEKRRTGRGKCYVISYP